MLQCVQGRLPVGRVIEGHARSVPRVPRIDSKVPPRCPPACDTAETPGPHPGPVDDIEPLRIWRHMPLRDEDLTRLLARMRAGQEPPPEGEPEGSGEPGEGTGDAEYELLTFPNGRHDDQADVFAYAALQTSRRTLIDLNLLATALEDADQGLFSPNTPV